MKCGKTLCVITRQFQIKKRVHDCIIIYRAYVTGNCFVLLPLCVYTPSWIAKCVVWITMSMPKQRYNVVLAYFT